MGAGAMYAFFRKYLLPKEILKLRKEIKKLKDQNDEKSDSGYEVISWWDPAIPASTVFGNLFSNREKHPRFICVNKTGEIREIPAPRQIKSGCDL